DAGPVAEHELPRAVPQGIRLRRHGQLLAVAPQVLGQERDRSISPAGFLAQRHQDDVVEVAPQLPPKLRGPQATRFAQRFLRRSLSAGSIGRARTRFARHAAGSRAWPLRILLADGALERVRAG